MHTLASNMQLSCTCVLRLVYPKRRVPLPTHSAVLLQRYLVSFQRKQPCVRHYACCRPPLVSSQREQPCVKVLKHPTPAVSEPARFTILRELPLGGSTL
jgi:hypothetical protein